MDTLIAFVDAIGCLADSFQRSQAGTGLVILLILSLVMGVWCWRRPSRVATRVRPKEANGVRKLFNFLLGRE